MLHRGCGFSYLENKFQLSPKGKPIPQGVLRELLVGLLGSPIPFCWEYSATPQSCPVQQPLARSSFTSALTSSRGKPADPSDCLKPSNSQPTSARVNMLIMTFSLGSSASLSRLTFILFFVLIYIFNVKSSSGISYYFLNLQFSKSCLFMTFYSINFF